MAHGRCQGVATLATLHDAYRATLTEAGPTQRQAATTLLFFTGGQDPAALVRQLGHAGLDIAEDDLSTALANAGALATRVLEGAAIDDTEFRHGTNVRWLGEAVQSTGCNRIFQAEARRAKDPEDAFSRAPRREQEAATATNLASTVPLAAAAIVVLLLAGYGLYRIYVSQSMRRRRVERMPRTSISLKLEVTFTDADGKHGQTKVEALDISVGGMKLNWPSPPPPGTTVTLEILDRPRISQIAWSNKFAAGVIFDTQLTKNEIAAVKELGTL